ncbi:MAG TPA: dihydropteroate synthase [Chloroflexota bacterium]|nr:dihydropteroate synthase [Chloroflexota bacterium]
MLEPGLLRCGGRVLRLGQRTLVMGIINLTPDSFSGDGLGGDLEAAAQQGRAMAAAGADVLDLGGESTRPGAESISEDVELSRALPAVERLAGELQVPISIDTRKARVARVALAAGAAIVNDVSGLEHDPRLAEVAAEAGAPIVLGHWRQRRKEDPADMVEWVASGLQQSVARARAAGVPRTQLVVDPGLGFAKRPAWSIEVLRRLSELRAAVGLPLLIGASRKGFIGQVLDRQVGERLEGSLAAAVLAVGGGADVVRVHDVPQTVRAVRMADAIVQGWSEDPQTWTPVYLGLGANLSDRAANLAAAIHMLSERPGVRVIRRSSLYETSPVGPDGQPDFLNSVLEAETTLGPLDLLASLKQIERALGRQPGPRWGPRPIDLDILLFGERQISSPDLTVPHPRLWDRLFVLEPLAELAPDLPAPDGATLATWVADRRDPRAVRPLGW